MTHVGFHQDLPQQTFFLTQVKHFKIASCFNLPRVPFRLDFFEHALLAGDSASGESGFMTPNHPAKGWKRGNNQTLKGGIEG